ncbi:MAG: glycosyltransferase family 2 protein [Bacteroidales bacterium]
MGSTPQISIVTVNFNGLSHTLELLASIQEHLPFREIETIVVDNGSTANETISIVENFPWAITIRSEENLGFAGGNNLGIERSSGQFIMFLNNDTIILDSSLIQLPSLFERDSSIAIVSPKILFHNPKGVIQYAGITPLSKITIRNRVVGYGEPDYGQYQREGECGYPHGAAMMVSRKAFEEVGPMPRLFFLYWEEIDWSEQFRRLGYKIWYSPQVTVAHKEGQSVGSLSYTKQYYMARNRLLYAKRNRTGLFRLLALSYLLLIAFPKELIIKLSNKELSLVGATIRGNFHFCRGKFGKMVLK